jgi:hypothetical protein
MLRYCVAALPKIAFPFRRIALAKGAARPFTPQAATRTKSLIYIKPAKERARLLVACPDRE